MFLLTVAILSGFSSLTIGQTIEASNYSCLESNVTVKFTDSFLSYSARHYASNCAIPRCNTNSSNCRLSSTPCFDYRSVDNTSYCAPGILCSLLEPCDPVTGTCAANTSVCIINSCCTPRAVCLSAFLTKFCTTTGDPNPPTGWFNTGNMTDARSRHTASLLNNTKVLVSGGSDINNNPLDRAELYDPSTGIWSNAARMRYERFDHTASVLNNGTVLVVGGQHYGASIHNSAELYDRSTDNWTPAGNMIGPRLGHTASVLNNGTVLVSGGYDGTSTVKSAELYDPSTGTWRTTGNMTDERYRHTASVLNNGKILVTGGENNTDVLNTAELYDPLTGNWTTTGNMIGPRSGHTASVLNNGKVLVSGGRDISNPLDRAELYDPLTGNWTTTGNMRNARLYHTASVLNNGKVLVSGAYYNNNGSIYLNSAELYDPLTGNWTTIGNMTNARGQHTASVLNNGKVLVCGGIGYDGSSYSPLKTAELY